MKRTAKYVLTLVLAVFATLAIALPARAQVVYVAEIEETGARYESLAQAINAAHDGDTVTLLQDTNGGYDIRGKAITLDLYGNTLTLGPSVGSPNTETSGIRVLSGAGLTIKNGTLFVSNIRNAAYEGNTERPYAGYVKVALANYGTMAIEDATITQDESDSRLIWAINNRGSLTVSGNTTIPNGTNPYADDNSTLTRAAINMTPYDYANTDATITVEDSTVTVGDILINDENDPASGGYTAERNIALNISAGTYGSITQTHTYESVNVAQTITGGTFTSDPTAYVADGYVATAADGVWTVAAAESQPDYVAEIVETGAYYETLQAAIDAAPAGEDVTINLLCDVTDGSGLMTPDSGNTTKDITIDFGGHTYVMKDPAVGSTGTQNQALHFGSGTVTLQNGTFRVADGAENVMMLLQNYCDLTLEDITLDASNVVKLYYDDPKYQAYPLWYGKQRPIVGFNNGTVTINSGTIIVAADDALLDVNLGDGFRFTDVTIEGGSFGGSFIVEGTENPAGSLTINGGSFLHDPSQILSMDDGETRSYLGEGYEAVLDSGWYKVRQAHSHTVTAEPEWTWAKSGIDEWQATAHFRCSKCGDVVDSVTDDEVERLHEDGQYIYTARVEYDGRYWETDKKVTSSFYVYQLDGSASIAGANNSYNYGTPIFLSTATKCNWFVNGVQVAEATTEYAVIIKEILNVKAEEVQDQSLAQMLFASIKADMDNDVANRLQFTVEWSVPVGSIIESATLYRGYIEDGKVVNAKTKDFAQYIKTTNGTYSLGIKNIPVGRTYGGYVVIRYQHPDSLGEITTFTSEIASTINN